MTSHTPPQTSRLGPAVACALAGAVVFQFFGNANHGYIDTASLFYWWGFQWVNPGSETEHGWLILALSAWLLARNLRAKETGDGRQEAGGKNAVLPVSRLPSPVSSIVAMLAGLALHALGFAAQQGRISIIAVLIFLWGVLRLAGGRRWGEAAAFPLGFMVFAIPLNVLDTAGFWLRMWVIDASAGLAHTAGIGVLQSGTQLLAPDGRYQYDVAAACSGVRSLTALAALSLLAGYLNFRTWWRRGAAMLLCFPLVYLGNVARISSIVFAAQLGGQAWGERAHAVMGYGVFVIVLGGVLAAVSALQRWWPETAPNGAAEAGGGRRETGETRTNVRSVWLVAVAVMMLATSEMFFLHGLASQPARGAAGVLLAADGKNPVELPAFLGIEWTGREVPVSPVEREILPPDTGFSRKIFFNHRDASKQVFVSIVLSGRDRTSIHRPEICLVGQGWTITGRTEHEFQFPARADAKFSASLLRVRREMPSPTVAGKPVAVPQLTAYWFVSGDAVVATHWELFAHDAWNRVAHARADRWAYVLLQTDATDGEPAALARMQAVLEATLPAFQLPLPAR